MAVVNQEIKTQSTIKLWNSKGNSEKVIYPIIYIFYFKLGQRRAKLDSAKVQCTRPKNAGVTPTTDLSMCSPNNP